MKSRSVFGSAVIIIAQLVVTTPSARARAPYDHPDSRPLDMDLFGRVLAEVTAVGPGGHLFLDPVQRVLKTQLTLKPSSRGSPNKTYTGVVNEGHAMEIVYLDWVRDWRLDLIPNKFPNLNEAAPCVSARSWLDLLKANDWRVTSSRPGTPGGMPPVMHLTKNGVEVDFVEDHSGICVSEATFEKASWEPNTPEPEDLRPPPPRR